MADARDTTASAKVPESLTATSSAQLRIPLPIAPLPALADGGTHVSVEEEPSPTGKLRYRRVIIKLSGEALSGKEGGSGIDTTTLKATASELAEVHSTGVQLGLVVGGGNIFRGLRG
ncbi:MAG TPA: hypothetical protein VGF76_12075, partial [Polyangiaceae bacterium]